MFLFQKAAIEHPAVAEWICKCLGYWGYGKRSCLVTVIWPEPAYKTPWAPRCSMRGHRVSSVDVARNHGTGEALMEVGRAPVSLRWRNVFLWVILCTVGMKQSNEKMFYFRRAPARPFPYGTNKPVVFQSQFPTPGTHKRADLSRPKVKAITACIHIQLTAG